MYVNVAFPLRMPPLTYKVPSGAPYDMCGRIVKAPLMGRSIFGLVMSSCEEPDMLIKKEIREVQKIYRIVMSARAIAFLQWLADYYLTPVGIALRCSFFEEIAAHATKGAEVTGDMENESVKHATILCETENNGALAAICTNIGRNVYRSFLSHAETSSKERLFLIAALTHLKDSLKHAVILVPEIAQLEHIVPSIKHLFGERVCVLHSKLAKKEESAALGRIVTGASDIVVGTRSAILAPFKQVSFIAVLAEHSRSYKAEEGLRYSGRDVAVMRGFHEKACVLLSSICPSVESIYNSEIGKYAMLEREAATIRTSNTDDITGKVDKEQGAERPKIKIVTLSGAGGARSKRAFTEGLSDLVLAPDVLKEARHLTALKERFLFLASRKGYSLLRCDECGFIERCVKCDVPVIFHKAEDMLKCHYCGSTQKVSESCVQCGGVSLKAYGAGTERVKEQVEALLKAEALLVEKGRAALRVFTENSPDLAPLVIGTSYAKGLTYKKSAAVEAGAPYVEGAEVERPFSAAAFLNMDALLLQPDFRLYERAFQEVVAVAQMVRKDGTVFLQTKMPQNKVLRFIKAYDFSGFYRYELSQRKAFNNPPFTKLVLFTIPVQEGEGRLLTEIQRIAGDVNTGNVDMLGPVELPYHSKKYHHCIQVLMKSKERNALHDTARSMMKGLAKIKGAKIIVEVDPLKI
jgi:primosomal protein N' (replication factor Y)